jgi:hypothetical protein
MMRFALVVDGHCAGFVLARRHQFEALDADEISLGLFETEDGAVAAIGQKLSLTKSNKEIIS